MAERDNRMVWDGRPLHYEVWYATLTHRASGTGFWIRYTIESPRAGDGEPYAQLWFARFDADDPTQTFGVNQRLPIGRLVAEQEPFALRLGEAVARDDGFRGAIDAGGHAIRWDLRWRPAMHTHRHLPDFAYGPPLGARIDTKVCAPNLDLAIDGEIVVDGKRYVCKGEPGGQSHVWGRKHAYQWAWSHCNGFEDAPGAVLESVSVRLRRGQVILPTLTVFTLRLDGEEHAFRTPWTLPLTRSEFSSGSYVLRATTAATRIEARYTCRPDDMLLAEYLDPDGDPAFNHITCVADVEVRIDKRVGIGRWREHRKLVARRAGHFEWGGRAGDVLHVKKQLQAY